MCEEMEKMGIGKQHADLEQLAKIKELHKVVSPVHSVSPNSYEKDKTLQYKRRNSSIIQEFRKNFKDEVGYQTRLDTFKDYRHQGSVSQIQKNLNRFEKNLAV